MANFENAIEVILKHEGGYVNNPADSGSETNWGIAKKFYPAIDIKSLTREQAKAIYKRDYWNGKCDWIENDTLATLFFDTAVNCGFSKAVAILQRTVNFFQKINSSGEVRVDGALGNITKNAVVIHSKAINFLPKFLFYRLEHYVSITAKSPKNKTFLLGWLKRTLSFWQV